MWTPDNFYQIQEGLRRVGRSNDFCAQDLQRRVASLRLPGIPRYFDFLPRREFLRILLGAAAHGRSLTVQLWPPRTPSPHSPKFLLPLAGFPGHTVNGRFPGNVPPPKPLGAGCAFSLITTTTVGWTSYLVNSGACDFYNSQSALCVMHSTATIATARSRTLPKKAGVPGNAYGHGRGRR